MKRRAIVVVTFVAGLFYFLEFLLPPRVGGAPDSAGASSPTVTDAGWIAYTGSAETRDPVILARRLGPTGMGPASVLISASPFRMPDYRGAQSPQAVQERLYYIGLGHDNKTPRLCAADRVGSHWKPRDQALLGPGPPGSWDASGVTWAHVVPTAGGYRLWYIGRQGNIGRVGTAISRDGLIWTRPPRPVLEPEPGESIESITVSADRDLPSAWWIVVGPTSPRGRVATCAVDRASGEIAGRPRPQPMSGPGLPAVSRGVLLDFRIEEQDRDGQLSRGALSYRSADGRPRAVGVTPGPSAVQTGRRDLILASQPLLPIGAPPRSTLLSDSRSSVDDILVVIGAFAVGLGLIGLARVHGKRIMSLQQGWPESTAFFAAALAMTVFTVYARLHPDSGTWGERTYNLLFYGLLQPLGSSMFSLLAAYLVSAAYRAFRVRSLESGLLAASAMLIMLGQVPIGNWLTQGLPECLQIPKIMAWVLFVSNNAVVRAVNFGIFVGALATALRVWLSMDRASMRSVE